MSPTLERQHMDYRFSDNFEKLHGISHRVADDAEAAAEIARICRHKQARCVALAGLPPRLAELIEESCGPDVEILKEPYPSDSLPLAIDRADIGVTAMAFAIAQSGTMVEVSENDAIRLTSSLPATHIGLIYEPDIIDKYFDASARIREIINSRGENVVISFISGPSRTGDIELKLTLGVHGPEEAHAVIISHRHD